MSNGQLKLKKILPERLRSLGLNESWLQDQIAADPLLLGLGDVELVRKERIQGAGGRIDFVMADVDGEARYEIEVMLGETDPSHIIRSIEYWDNERQRYPQLEHYAVLVAEGITARFFNVIRILNRAVPMIAIQLSAFRIDDEVVLQFTRVLDTYDFGGDPQDEENAEVADRAYWEKKVSPKSLAVVDAIKALTPATNGEPRLTYNKTRIRLSTGGYKFCSFTPSRDAHCRVRFTVGAENRPRILKEFEAAGIETTTAQTDRIRIRLDAESIQKHRDLISDVIRTAEAWSHR